MNQEVPWKRIAVEVMAIVGSILLAFAIDAWWDDRSDAAQVESAFQRLLAEMREVESQLEVQIRSHSDSRAVLENLLSKFGPDPSPVPPEEIANFLLQSIFVPQFIPRQTTLENLLASGDITDTAFFDSYYEQYSLFPYRISALVADSERLERNRDDMVFRSILDNGFPWGIVATASGTQTANRDGPFTKFALDTELFLGNVQIESSLHVRLGVTHQFIRNLEEAVAQTRGMIFLIENELE